MTHIRWQTCIHIGVRMTYIIRYEAEGGGWPDERLEPGTAVFAARIVNFKFDPFVRRRTSPICDEDDRRRNAGEGRPLPEVPREMRRNGDDWQTRKPIYIRPPVRRSTAYYIYIYIYIYMPSGCMRLLHSVRDYCILYSWNVCCSHYLCVNFQTRMQRCVMNDGILLQWLLSVFVVSPVAVGHRTVEAGSSVDHHRSSAGIRCTCNSAVVNYYYGPSFAWI